MTTIGEHSRFSKSLFGLLSIVVSCAWLLIFIYSVHAALAFNPITLPLEEHISPQIWLPQGWKFFTRNPREDIMRPYVRGANRRWIGAFRGPNAGSSNLFGIRRATRAQGIELGLLMTSVNEAAWQECKEEPITCLEGAPLTTIVKSVNPNPTLCGEIGLTLQPPTPWAWSRSRRKTIMPSKVTRVYVKC